MQTVAFNGWKNCVRLANREVELIVTRDVGPRVIRFGFMGARNLFAEIAGQQGGHDETEWMIRGGHRLWIAPEEHPRSYELDNVPVSVEEIPNGVRTRQAPGPLTHAIKEMQITLDPRANAVRVLHVLRNGGSEPIALAPWAPTAMAPDGMAVIPLPAKIPHTRRLTHNQGWSIWAYTDFSDPRWTLGSRYVFFRQDRKRGPNKLGIAHREGWVGYLLDEFLFVKRFAWQDGGVYPDGGVNFETFSNEEFLEIESLGAMATLEPEKSAVHEERWELHRGIPRCATEADVDRHVIPRVC